MKKNGIIVLIAISIAVSLFAFFSGCSKESDEADGNATAFSAHKSKMITHHFSIGYALKEKEPTLYVDKDIYECAFGKVVAKRIGSEFVFEDIKIEDSIPFKKDIVAVLHQTLFNVETGETINFFTELDKLVSGDRVEYYTTSKDSERREVTCIGKNCEEGGCRYDSENNGCTKCGNEKGTCETHDEPQKSDKIVWKDVIGWGITILAALISVLL